MWQFHNICGKGQTVAYVIVSLQLLRSPFLSWIALKQNKGPNVSDTEWQFMTNGKILNDCSVTKPAINSTGRIRHRVRTGNFICHDLDETKSNIDITVIFIRHIR